MATEKRLIDANVALAKQFTSGLSDLDGNYYGYADVIFADDIANSPTVDAVEVVHGRWIEIPSMAPEYECSECGQSYEWWEPSEAHYCPNCGAKMDGDGNA